MVDQMKFKKILWPNQNLECDLKCTLICQKKEKCLRKVVTDFLMIIIHNIKTTMKYQAPIQVLIKNFGKNAQKLEC